MSLKRLSNTRLIDAFLCFTKTPAQFPQCIYDNLSFSFGYFLTLGLPCQLPLAVKCQSTVLLASFEVKLECYSRKYS